MKHGILDREKYSDNAEDYPEEETWLDLARFQRALRRCIEFINRPDLDQEQRKFSFRAKRVLNLMLKEARHEDVEEDARQVVLLHKDKTKGDLLTTISSPGKLPRITAIRTHVSLHAGTLLTYLKYRETLGRISRSRFGWPLFHNHCKYCKRIVHVGRRKTQTCGARCYRKLKGKAYFAKKAKKSYRKRKEAAGEVLNEKGARSAPNRKTSGRGKTVSSTISKPSGDEEGVAKQKREEEWGGTKI